MIDPSPLLVYGFVLLAVTLAAAIAFLTRSLVGFLLLLLNIMTVAMLSAPLPIRVFHNEPANVWILRAPFIWLPVFFVPVALAGHLMVWRSLRRRR